MKKPSTNKPKGGRPTVAIVAIGDELLHDRLDTNSHEIQTILLQHGIETQVRVVVADEVRAIAKTLHSFLANHSLIICCGGLGPTQDDITRQAIARVCKQPLLFQPAMYQTIIRRFKKRGVKIPDCNKQQACFPRRAVILKNRFGTAPGFLLQTKSRMIAALPGPPGECRAMLEKELLPRLKRSRFKNSNREAVQHLRIVGMAESQLQEIIGPRLTQHPDIQLGFLLEGPGEILIKLQIRPTNKKQAQAALRSAVREVQQALGKSVVDRRGRSLPEVIGRLLLKQKQTIAVAESCTGGRIAQRLVSIPGSSKYFVEGAVTYSNQAKHRCLQVTAASLKKYGAVSAEVAMAMAKGMRQKSQATWALAITGIAGPGGGSKSKPVGLVYLGIAGPQGRRAAKKLQLSGDRERIQCWSATLALDWVRRCLLEKQAVGKSLTDLKRIKIVP